MSTPALVERFYDLTKRGVWDQVIATWIEDAGFARRCAHWVKPSSGWTFLHQAAFHNNEVACRLLIRWGAILVAAKDGKTPADVATKHGHTHLTELFDEAFSLLGDLWQHPGDPDSWPSSNYWSQARPRIAPHLMLVAYGGGRVKIGEGDTYFVDHFERVLIGWHGTYNPPCGMDGDSMIPNFG